MVVGCGGVGLGYGSSADLPAQVALVSLRNSPGTMFLLCRGIQAPSCPAVPPHSASVEDVQCFISMLFLALAFITAGADGWSWTAALPLQKSWLTWWEL